MKKLVFGLVLPFSLLIGNEISLDELKSFSAQKYRIDYDAQKIEDKEKIATIFAIQYFLLFYLI